MFGLPSAPKLITGLLAARKAEPVRSHVAAWVLKNLKNAGVPHSVQVVDFVSGHFIELVLMVIILMLLCDCFKKQRMIASLLDKNFLALEDIAEFELQLRDRIDALEGSAGRPLAKLGSIDCVIDLTEDDEDDPDPAHHQTLKADGAGEWIS